MFSKTPDDRGPAAGQGARAEGAGRSVLASDLRIDGVVATEGALEVNGMIEGEVAADSLLLGQEGRISGKVRAHSAELRGRLSGEIAATRLTLRAAAQMAADATCETLVIESGAEVEGRFARPVPTPALAPSDANTTPSTRAPPAAPPAAAPAAEA